MPEMPEFSIQRTAGEPEGSAGAKGRTKPPKATAKPYGRHILGIDSGVQSHHRATTKPSAWEYRATPKPPQCDPKATLRLHQGSTKATPKPHQSHTKAWGKPIAHAGGYCRPGRASGARLSPAAATPPWGWCRGIRALLRNRYCCGWGQPRAGHHFAECTRRLTLVVLPG